MGFEIEGKVHLIEDAVQVTEKFRKRGFVIEIDPYGRYPQACMFEFTNDRCELLDLVRVGDGVTVEFSLRGREWTNSEGEVKFFNTLSAWKVDVRESQAVPPSDAPDEEGGGL